jgi:CDP-paratose 2-epimerase
VAVTRSLEDPRADFEINALGTLHVLEAVRALRRRPAVFFTSTNKVYGALGDTPLRRAGTRWEPEDLHVSRHGVSEDRRLDCHSPHGCSKGAADQYVLDFARSYGLDTVVLRMSCIYGPRQFGTEDQGWVAHFLRRVLRGEPITIYGDGLQVRDVLYVDDLVEAFVRARRHVGEIRGEAFNIGGGPENSVSLVELLDLVEEMIGRPPAATFAPARTGDQRYYVSDTRRFSARTGWAPQVRVAEGLRRLHDWLREGAAEARR